MTEDEARAAALALIPQGVEPLTLSELEQYLAAAADLLRGSIDQADFKAYIFPLMFFKRISDVYLEEYAQALDESGGDHEFALFAENHRFAIPSGSLWEDVRSHTENIGTALQTALREIEKANPEDVGLSTDRLERIHDAIQRHIDDGNITGAVTAATRRGGLAHLEAHGFAQFEAGACSEVRQQLRRQLPQRRVRRHHQLRLRLLRGPAARTEDEQRHRASENPGDPDPRRDPLDHPTFGRYLLHGHREHHVAYRDVRARTRRQAPELRPHNARGQATVALPVNAGAYRLLDTWSGPVPRVGSTRIGGS